MSPRAPRSPGHTQPYAPSTADLATLATRLTERDRILCRVLLEHRVLTTGQCLELAFWSSNAAQHRLLLLTRLGVLDRFRPARDRGEGSAPWHYVLGPAGADVLAAEQETTPAALGYKRDRALSIAHSQRLAHQLGVNGFFTSLTAYTRHHAGAELVTWWSERQCAQQWGRLVRPDAYGRWHDRGREVDFFLEYDTGTEPLERLVTKLEGYTDLAIGSGIRTPVLFWLPGPGRERGLHAALQTAPQQTYDRALVPVATATARNGAHPAEAVWWLAGTQGARRRLVAVTDADARERL